MVFHHGGVVSLLYVSLDHNRSRRSAVSALTLCVGHEGELVAAAKLCLEVLKRATAEQGTLRDDGNPIPCSYNVYEPLNSMHMSIY